jgi:simple sugar transport system permease protein
MMIFATVTPSMIWGTFLGLVIAFAIPMILVAYGGMYSEHSGIVNIALEGIMVIGAMTSAIICRQLNGAVQGKQMASWAAMLIAILAAGLAGALFSLLLSFASNRLKADQTIAGTALNIMAPAIFLIGSTAVNSGVETDWITLPTWTTFDPSDFGMTTTSFFRSFSVNTICLETTFFALVLIPLAAFILYRTRFGLRLRSCGEHPEASASLGLNVVGYRYAGVTISGFLAGIGGTAYILASTSDVYGDVAGIGFLALAVMIFGNWDAIKILGAALFFAFFKTLGNMTATLGASNNDFLKALVSFPRAEIVYAMLPYIVTLIVLIFTSKHSQAPKAEGTPFDISRRS